jgi:hypothetical protein
MDLEWSGRSLTEVLEGLIKTMKDLSQDSRCPSLDSNRASPEYEPRVLQQLTAYSKGYAWIGASVAHSTEVRMGVMSVLFMDVGHKGVEPSAL